MHAMNSGGSQTYEECGGIFFLLVTAPCHVQGSFVWLCQYNVSVLVLISLYFHQIATCNIRGTKLLHLSQTEYPPCFINGVNFRFKMRKLRYLCRVECPLAGTVADISQKFCVSNPEYDWHDATGPWCYGLQSETVHFRPITTVIQRCVHQSGALAESRALIQALWHGTWNITT